MPKEGIGFYVDLNQELNLFSLIIDVKQNLTLFFLIIANQYCNKHSEGKVVLLLFPSPKMFGEKVFDENDEMKKKLLKWLCLFVF